MVSSIVRSVDRTKEATMGNKDNNYTWMHVDIQNTDSRHSLLKTAEPTDKLHGGYLQPRFPCNGIFFKNTGSILHLKRPWLYSIGLFDQFDQDWGGAEDWYK